MQHQPELEWFAYFITGSEVIAEACVIDARGLSDSHNQVFEDWLLKWARYATIRSAIQAQRDRRMLYASAHGNPTCEHRAHATLEPATVEFVIENSEILIKRLHALSRVALVAHGIEKLSLVETAVLAGVSLNAVRAAYCAALQHVDVVLCEELRLEQEHAPLYH